jgi:signal transduction histidine kinase
VPKPEKASGSQPFNWGPADWFTGTVHIDPLFQTSEPVRARRDDEDGVLTGSGLGLSILQWIAQAHSGRVSVESRPGQDTSLEVGLPLAWENGFNR